MLATPPPNKRGGFLVSLQAAGQMGTAFYPLRGQIKDQRRGVAFFRLNGTPSQKG